jgi:predicted Zn-dependent protease
MKPGVHLRIVLPCALTGVFCACLLCSQPAAGAQRGRGSNNSPDLETQTAESELQKAIALTKTGKFQEAIPHFVAARGRVSDEYLVDYNLALCYVATGQDQEAVLLLTDTRAIGRSGPEIQNLLAQAYVGLGQQDKAFAALQEAARMAPKDEKMYVLAAEACIGDGANDLGLKVIDLGLQHLPKSGRLHFERGMLLIQLDRLDEARADLGQTIALSPGTDVAYIAAAQKDLLDGDVEAAVSIAREGIHKGHSHFMLLSIFGEAVLRAGIDPSQPEFAEARAALEKAVAESPTYPSAQIDLGKLYLAESRTADAIARLNAARELDPRNPAVYSNLAAAYRKSGDAQHEQESLTILAQLNKAQADKIATAPGDTRAGYGAHTSHQQ